MRERERERERETCFCAPVRPETQGVFHEMVQPTNDPLDQRGVIRRELLLQFPDDVVGVLHRHAIPGALADVHPKGARSLRSQGRPSRARVSHGRAPQSGGAWGVAHHVGGVEEDREGDQQQAEIETMRVRFRRVDDTKVLQQDEGELDEAEDHQLLVDLVHHAEVGWAGLRLRSDGWSGAACRTGAGGAGERRPARERARSRTFSSIVPKMRSRNQQNTIMITNIGPTQPTSASPEKMYPPPRSMPPPPIGRPVGAPAGHSVPRPFASVCVPTSPPPVPGPRHRHSRRSPHPSPSTARQSVPRRTTLGTPHAAPSAPPSLFRLPV